MAPSNRGAPPRAPGLAREGRSNSGLNLSALQRGTFAAHGAPEPPQSPVRRGGAGRGARAEARASEGEGPLPACKFCEHVAQKKGDVPAFHWCTRDKTVDRSSLDSLPDFGAIGTRWRETFLAPARARNEK